MEAPSHDSSQPDSTHTRPCQQLQSLRASCAPVTLDGLSTFHSYSNHVKSVLSLCPFYRGRNRVSRSWSNLPKVMVLSGRARTVGLLRPGDASPCSESHMCTPCPGRQHFSLSSAVSHFPVFLPPLLAPTVWNSTLCWMSLNICSSFFRN